MTDIPKLTQADVDTLTRAAELERRFQSGIFPVGGGGKRHFDKLERLGLIRLDGWGRDIDGQIDRDVAVYRLTERGKFALAEARLGRKETA